MNKIKTKNQTIKQQTNKQKNNYNNYRTIVVKQKKCSCQRADNNKK